METPRTTQTGSLSTTFDKNKSTPQSTWMLPLWDKVLSHYVSNPVDSLHCCGGAMPQYGCCQLRCHLSPSHGYEKLVSGNNGDYFKQWPFCTPQWAIAWAYCTQSASWVRKCLAIHSWLYCTKCVHVCTQQIISFSFEKMNIDWWKCWCDVCQQPRL